MKKVVQLSSNDLQRIVENSIENMLKKRTIDESKNMVIANVFEINVNGDKKYASLITEAGLNRMLSHGKNGMIIISACRSEIPSDNPNCNLVPEYEKFIQKNNLKDSEGLRKKWLNNRNKLCDAELKYELRHSAFSYSQTYGGYHDKGKPNSEDSFEPSYVVYNYTKNGEPLNFDDLFDLALYWCEKYHQDSVYVQAPDKAPVYVNEKGDVVSSKSSKNFITNDPKQEFFTTVKRSKGNPHTVDDNTDKKQATIPQRFTADIQFENMMLPIGPGSLTELKKRTDRGEYLLTDFK